MAVQTVVAQKLFYFSVLCCIILVQGRLYTELYKKAGDTEIPSFNSFMSGCSDSDHDDVHSDPFNSA